MMPLQGRRVGKLKFLMDFRDEFGHWFVWTSCDCGNLFSLKRFSTNRDTGCGCVLTYDQISKRDGFNGKKIVSDRLYLTVAYKRAYNSYRSMLKRCLNASAIGYEHYGGRGITVASEWIDSFESFLRDMGDRPVNCTLDRINNDGNYEKNNCRWASVAVQSSNKRTNKYLVYNGEKVTISEFSRIIGISKSCARVYVEKYGSAEAVKVLSKKSNKIKNHHTHP